jgi:DNA-binding transcriptional LysR family regulator
MLDIELRHLRYFVAVAEELNFSRAALRLGIQQPPLSRQIKHMEDELKVRLLERDRRGVSLTEAGRTYLEGSRELLNQVSSLAEETKRVADRRAQLIRIGIASGLSQTVCTALLEHAKSGTPLDFDCFNISSTQQNAALRERQIDIAFMRPPIDRSSIVSEPIFRERVRVLLPKTHPLAGRDGVYVSELAKERILIHERKTSSGVYDKIIELFRAAGVVPSIVPSQSGPHDEAGPILVVSGKGIYLGVGSTMLKAATNHEVVTVPILDRGAVIEVHVAWRHDERSKALEAFLNTVRGFRTKKIL